MTLEGTTIRAQGQVTPEGAAAYKHTLLEGVGKHARNVDTALPGPHTKRMYDLLDKHEAKVLA